jgi:hypothetical protein
MTAFHRRCFVWTKRCVAASGATFVQVAAFHRRYFVWTKRCVAPFGAPHRDSEARAARIHSPQTLSACEGPRRRRSCSYRLRPRRSNCRARSGAAIVEHAAHAPTRAVAGPASQTVCDAPRKRPRCSLVLKGASGRSTVGLCWRDVLTRACQGADNAALVSPSLVERPSSVRDFTVRLSQRVKSRMESHFEPRIESRSESHFEPRIESRIEPRIEPRIESHFEPRIESRSESHFESRMEWRSVSRLPSPP